MPEEEFSRPNPTQVAEMIVSEHLDDGIKSDDSYHFSPDIKIKDIQRLTQDFPTTHFGNEFTKSGPELKRVDNLYDQILKKMMSDSKAAPKSQIPGGPHPGFYFRKIESGPQELLIQFETYGDDPNSLMVIYKRTLQPDVSEINAFKISPKEIQMENYRSLGPTQKEGIWEDQIKADADKELDQRERLSLHMFEKAAKMYLSADSTH